jgi:hypothetical protein|tara:strand:- start:10 stop:738 length:729 start_codon:yes stop_codon:yes gene_type:complete
MAETYIIENVEALWPKLNQTYAFDKKANKHMPCGPRDTNAAFSVDFRADSATAKALFAQMSAAYNANKEKSWPQELTLEASPLVKDDDGTFKGTSNIKGAYSGRITEKPVELDSQGNTLPEDFELTTGSTVNIAVTFVPYHMTKDNWGVSLRLQAVQVIKYVTRPVRNPFGNVAGGYVVEVDEAEETAKKIFKSNNVLAVAEEAVVIDMFDEEPVKKTAKKAETASSEDKLDLTNIVKGWDD